MTPFPESRTFACSRDGAIAAGQRRLARVFALLGAALVLAAAFAFATGQILAGLIALLLAFAVFVIHRMSRELDPTELVIEGNTLTIFMRHALRRLPLEGSTVRRLTQAEIEHLSKLASSGGFVASAGGFDSHLLGEFDLYASRIENAVLLETEDGRVVVTPDQPETFSAAIAGASG